MHAILSPLPNLAQVKFSHYRNYKPQFSELRHDGIRSETGAQVL